MIKRYYEFLNEKLTDNLIGKTEDEIIVFLKTLEPNDMLEKALELNFNIGIKLAIDNGATIKNYQLKRSFNDGNYEIVKYFIQHTNNIMQYYDMFMLLVKNKNIELLQLMFNNGFEIDDSLISSVEVIARTDDTVFMKFLLNNIDLNKYGEYLMINALMHSDIKMIKFLIDYGIDINMKHYDPIEYACYNKKYKEIIKCLLNNGLNKNEYLNSTLKSIITRGLVNQVKYLVEKLGADINIINYDIFIINNVDEMKKLIKKLKELK